MENNKSKYLVIDGDVATFFLNEENPKSVAKWGFGLLERENNPKISQYAGMEEVSIHMKRVLDKLIEGDKEFFPLDGTLKYPLIYDECNDEVKNLIDDTFHDEAVRKFYELSDEEEIY